jgi:hypothetical protein
MSPTKAMISPIQKLQTNISTIPTMTMMPPREMPAIPRRSSDLATRFSLRLTLATAAYSSKRRRPANAAGVRDWQLLPQPHRLEGFDFSPVVAPPDALPSRHSAAVQSASSSGVSLPAPWPRIAHGSERQVAEVAHRDGLGDDVGQKIDQVLPPASDSIVTVIAALDRDHAWEGLRVGVDQCQKGTQVASVKGVIGLVSQLHFSRDIAYPRSPTASRASLGDP